jgi:hypothetical protein
VVVSLPGIGNARAAVKQYKSEISPTGVSGGTTTQPFTVTITDCGSSSSAPCTASSTIQLGSVQVLVPTRFSNVAFVGATSPNGRNWTGTWDGTYIQAWSVTGADRLNAGEMVNLNFTADVSGCQTGSFQFTTTAWGSTPGHSGETFLPLAQPSVSVNGCSLANGDSITDPTTGQTETVGGGFDGHVNVIFGGNLDCSSDPTFGAQWSQYHLPSQFQIVPANDYSASSPKTSTSTFAPAAGADSSWYLICYAVPQAGHDAFATRGNGTAQAQTIGGTDYWVGILPNCYNAATGTTRSEPCVSEQYKDIATGKVVISLRVPAGDPLKH